MTSSPCFIIDDNCQIMLQEVWQKELPLKIEFRKWRLCKSFTSHIRKVEDGIIALAIPVPEQENPIELAQWESEITISFNYNYQKCVFTTQVQEESPHEIKSGVMSQIILISQPQMIEAYPQRNCERMFISPGEVIPVQMSGLDNQTAQTRIIGKNLQGVLHDISNGGVGVKVPQKVLADISLGDQFEICIVPIPSEEPLLLKARLCHVTELPKQEQILLGFQLKAKIQSERYGILIDKLHPVLL